jgi:SAM-dependent methyltransferase
MEGIPDCPAGLSIRIATMPLLATTGQPDHATDWFSSASGRALLLSEFDALRHALGERPGQPWMWLAPMLSDIELEGHGLRMRKAGSEWHGSIRCQLPLPLANESMATVVLQHVARGNLHGRALFQECTRVLVPGGRLWLLVLNPLAPYRWRWKGSGLTAAEPMLWRRRLRAAGLHPDPVSRGIGPRWRIQAASDLQHGPGLRAAFVLRAEKKSLPLTPLRTRAAMRVGEGLPTT